MVSPRCNGAGQQHVDMLAQTAPQKACVAAYALDPSRPEDAEEADSHGAPFEGRAAALLSMKTHRILASRTAPRRLPKGPLVDPGPFARVNGHFLHYKNTLFEPPCGTQFLKPATRAFPTLQTAGCGLATADWSLRTGASGLVTAACSLRTGDNGLVGAE